MATTSEAPFVGKLFTKGRQENRENLGHSKDLSRTLGKEHGNETHPKK